MSTALLCSDLAYSTPDGTCVLDGLDLELGSGRTGLVGVNGSGKSTLLRLAAGLIRPSRGSVTVRGEAGYLPQDLTLSTGRRVDEVLGVARTRAALRAIERGDVRDENFAAVGDDWDVEERAAATLGRLGLGRIGLDRRVGELSGGESVLLALAALLLRRPAVLLLDEPTNNLDRSARRRLDEALAGFPGTVLVVSHDRSLLRLVDGVVELRDGRARQYGGNLDAYEAAVRAEQATAERLVSAARADVRRQHRELVDAQTRLARRARYGRERRDDQPKILTGARKRKAQVSAGRERGVHEGRLEVARERLAAAEEAVRSDAVIRVDLPLTEVPAGRGVLRLTGAVLPSGETVSLDVRGPERIALVGPNGSGKTTLLEAVAGRPAPGGGRVDVRVPVRYLPQRLDVLDDARSVVDNVSRAAPSASVNEVRARLARFGFTGRRGEQTVATLSGGERFRATLAALLLAEPAPQLLLLDEPTNTLDLAGVRSLTEALAGYRGALVVASHDDDFLEEIGVTRTVRLGARSG